MQATVNRGAPQQQGNARAVAGAGTEAVANCGNDNLQLRNSNACGALARAPAGTCETASTALGVVHISTGDIFREEVAANELGRKAKALWIAPWFPMRL